METGVLPTLLRGRDREEARAAGVLRSAVSSGQGGIVLLTGEAGIGKSALLAGVIERARELGYRVGAGKAEEIDQIAAGAPLLVALRSGAQPLLDGDTFTGLAELYEQHLWLVDRIATLLEDLAVVTPILIAIDDVQWADRLTRFALRVLPGRLAGAPVIWALAARDTPEHRFDDPVSAVTQDAVVTRIDLGPLSAQDLEELAVDHLGGVPSEAARALLRGSGGNPLLAVELLDGLALARAEGSSQDEVPEGLIHGVRRRLYLFPSDVLALIQLVAVLGHPLSIDDAMELLGWTSVPEAVASVRILVADGLLVESGGLLSFRHDLLREAVYADLSPALRRRLHQRCMRFMLAAGEGALAAAHARSGAVPGDREAVGVLVSAAVECSRRMPDSAADLMSDAFRLTDLNDPARYAVGKQAVEMLIRAHREAEAVAIADLLTEQDLEPDRVAQVGVLVARALLPLGRFAEILARTDSALAVPGVSAPLRARLRGSRLLCLARSEPSPAAWDAGLEMLAEGRQVGDQETEFLARRSIGEIARRQGRQSAALEQFRMLRLSGETEFLAQEIMALQSLDRYEEAGTMLRAARLAADPEPEILVPSLMQAQLWHDFDLARLDAAEADAQTLLHLNAELGRNVYQVDGWITLTVISLIRSDLRAAEHWLAEAEAGATAPGSVPNAGLVFIQGWTAMAKGDAERGRTLLDPLLRTAQSAPAELLWWPGLMRIFVQVGQAAGDDDFAHAAAALAQNAADRNPQVRSITGSALHLHGLLAEDPDELGAAVEVLEGSPRPLLQANARTDHGLVLLRAGDRDRGVEQLEMAAEALDRIGARATLRTVARALKGAGARRRNWATEVQRPNTGWEALTQAERRVAELIGAGHTNRSAANELYLSPNTVATHLRTIFAKLGVKSRVQLTNAMNARSAAGRPASE
jgi:DNA-binding CsgD family transcriptional regulator/tetratricopeptide (TPR) repeat protein